jgi:hypothetical protein
VTKEEAQQFLEERDFCLKHFVRQEKGQGSRKPRCPECETEKSRAEAGRIEQAIRVLKGEPEVPPLSPVAWTPWQTGTLPPNNERVYIVCIGFAEQNNRAGGKEAVTIGKPVFWRKK